MTLNSLALNQTKTISHLIGAFNNEYKEWMESLGIFEGNSITCFKKETLNQPSIYRVGNFTFAMSKEVGLNIHLMD